MESFKTVVIDPVGLHARPASIIVSKAGKFESDIQVKHNDKSGNMKSIMSIMALGVKKGDNIEIVASGKDEDEAIKEIKNTLIENKII